MEQRIVYLSRLRRLPLLGADGADIGRIDDAVVDLGSKPPRVNGLVVAIQRRKVFVAITRIGEIASEGARLRRGSVNQRHFELKPGERLLQGEVIDKRLKGERVIDVGLTPTPEAGDTVRAQAQAVKDALAAWHAPYDYYNFAETPAGADAVLPPASYRRLEKIKATYDPDQAIISAHPVWPAGR